jgi:hypothetical protein
MFGKKVFLNSWSARSGIEKWAGKEKNIKRVEGKANEQKFCSLVGGLHNVATCA